MCCKLNRMGYVRVRWFNKKGNVFLLSSGGVESLNVNEVQLFEGTNGPAIPRTIDGPVSRMSVIKTGQKSVFLSSDCSFS